MSITTELARIKGGVAGIRSKYVELGIAQSTDKIDALATASEQIENKGAVTATVTEGATYTIPKGYHNGSGTVTGLAPAATGTIQKWWSPKMTANNSPSPYQAYCASSGVIINDQDVWHLFDGDDDTYCHISSRLGDKYLVFGFGTDKTIYGVRLVRGKDEEHEEYPSVAIDGLYASSYAKPKDYEDFAWVGSLTAAFNENGVVEWKWFDNNGLHTPKPRTMRWFALRIRDTDSYPFCISEIEFLIEEPITKYSLQSTKNVTPTTQQQNVTPDSGYYGLSSVVINPIPNNYKDTSVVSATADDVLSGKVIIDRTGELVTGTMVNNGDLSQTMDGLETASVEVTGGYCEESTISLDDTIEQALAEI